MVQTTQLSETDNLLGLSNPFSNRGPVIDPTQFYGRHDDVMNVAQSIKYWQILAISGEPRIGKTSLLYYLVHPEGARTQSDFKKCIGAPEDYLFVLIELQRLPVISALGFWRYLLYRLIEEAKKEDVTNLKTISVPYKEQNLGSDQYEVQINLESYLTQLSRKVVFLFDDFDVLIKDLEPTEVIQVTDKLKTLKESLDLNERLNYIIVSTDPLVRLFKINEIFNISPLISIINPLPPLGLLEQDNDNALMQVPLRHYTIKFTEHDISFIYRLAGRFPAFMKIICYYLFSAYNSDHVDYSTVQQQLADDSHVLWLMNDLWERLKRDERLEKLPLCEVLLQIAQGQQPTNSAAFRELRQRGLVEGTPAHIFGDIFCTFVAKQSLTVTTESPLMATSPIKLTQKEAILYDHLAAHMGQTCSREQLQEAIWGDSQPNSPDALEQLVKRLRSKIEPDKHPTYLLNVKGQGYRLTGVSPRLA